MEDQLLTGIRAGRSPERIERRPGRVAAVVGVVVIAAAACSVAGSPSVHPEASEQVVEFVDRNWAAIPDPQRSVLADRYLTWGEYEGAVLDTIACLRGQGIEVNGPYEMNDGRYLDYGYVGGPDDDQPCYAEHLSFVAQAWEIQQMPTGVELEEVTAAYAACLTEAGYPPPAGADLPALELFVFELFQTEGAVPAVDACVERYSNAHKITRLP